jgi:hypothetical protein
MLFPVHEFFLRKRQAAVDAHKARHRSQDVGSASQITGSAGHCLPQNDMVLAYCDAEDNTSSAGRPRRRVSRRCE